MLFRGRNRSHPNRSECTVYDFMVKRARKSPNQVAVRRRRGVGGWTGVTARQLLNEIDECARGFLGMGLKKGDRVAIMASTSYEWMLLDYAASSLGIVIVPIYDSDSAEQITWITRKAHIQMAICDTIQRYELLEHACAPTVKQFLTLESDGLQTLIDAGAHVDENQLTTAQSQPQIDDIATIIFTSGTTGKPKGAILRHRNFVDTIYAIHERIPYAIGDPNQSLLLFLPLAHVLARFVQYAVLAGPAVVAHSPDTKNLLTDMESLKPSALLLVPRVLEKIYNAAEAKAGKGLRLKLFRWAASRAIAFSKAQHTRLGPSARLRAEKALAHRLVLHRVTDVLGPMQYMVIGGSPLSSDLGHFFHGLGIEILQGWGLSETTGPATLSDPVTTPMESVGSALPGNELRISSDGEVCVRGDVVFHGYLDDPEQTQEALQDGWFHTGDLGTLDERGNLTITGRMKDLIVTAGGKNVSPAVLEDALITHPLIAHVVVVGEKRPYIGALITLDEEMLPTWLENHGLDPISPIAATHDPNVRASLDRAIKRANKAVSRAESIRRFRIINAQFTVDNGYLTPSLKIKRNVITRDFANEIDALYNEEDD